MPALGSVPTNRPVSTAHNAQEYELFLRALAIPRDDARFGKQAIRLLEQVIQHDPQYAAGWYQLGVRYYDDVNYGSGDDAEYQRAIEYHERAVALDPDFLQAQRGLAITKAESHQPTAAWAQERLLLRKWPNDSDSHLPCHTFCDMWAYPRICPGMRNCRSSRSHQSFPSRLWRALSANGQLGCYPVSTRINHVGNDDEECSQRVELVQMQPHLFS